MPLCKINIESYLVIFYYLGIKKTTSQYASCFLSYLMEITK